MVKASRNSFAGQPRLISYRRQQITLNAAPRSATVKLRLMLSMSALTKPSSSLDLYLWHTISYARDVAKQDPPSTSRADSSNKWQIDATPVHARVFAENTACILFSEPGLSTNQSHKKSQLHQSSFPTLFRTFFLINKTRQYQHRFRSRQPARCPTTQPHNRRLPQLRRRVSRKPAKQAGRSRGGQRGH